MIRVKLESLKEMTVKDEIHGLIEQLPEQSLADVRQFIEDLRGAGEPEDEPLDQETLQSLDRGLGDIRSGRAKSLADYERETPGVSFHVSLANEAEKMLDRIDLAH